ncbi:MAG: hypothetical protein IIC07_00750 [Proteobacteria bacterium]|nr:hypothetical protein [Pseudomonadota bacterium]
MTQKPAPNPKVLHIHPYVPGESGDGGGRIIKLASNESALGPSPKVREAIEVELGCLARYPDGSSTLLRQKIGEVYGLDHKHIVCGNGSEQLIAYLAQIYAGPGDQVIQSEFGFIAYKIATLAAGALDQWGQWRGPLGNGVAPHGRPPVEWNEGRNIRWKVAIRGQGHSTPIVWGDRIFQVADLDGYRWTFAQNVADFDPANVPG